MVFMISDIDFAQFQPYLDDPRLAITGRVKTFLENPERGTLPDSCTTIRPDFKKILTEPAKMFELVQFLSVALRKGAGINVHLDDFPDGPDDPAVPVNIDIACHFKDGFLFSGDAPPEPPYVCYVVQDSMDYDPNALPDLASCLDDLVVSIDQAIALAASIGCDLVDHDFRGFDLRALREAGSTNSLGLVASGGESFAKLILSAHNWGNLQTLESFLTFLSDMNGTIRRGGLYRNGIITTTMPFNHPLVEEYIAAPPSVCKWIRKGLGVLHGQTVADLPKGTSEAVNAGTLWLEKLINPGEFFFTSEDYLLREDRLLGNVCREILLADRSTCLISHVNLGKVGIDEIPDAMCRLMEFLIKIWDLDLPQYAGIYADKSVNKQVGLGFIGLANLLAKEGVTYAELVTEMYLFLLERNFGYPDLDPDRTDVPSPFQFANLEFILSLNKEPSEKGARIAKSLFTGFKLAGEMARNAGLNRAFTVAPTANCSFKYEDSEGFATTPEISPPQHLMVTRPSTSGDDYTEDRVFMYPPQAETIGEVTPEVYYALVELWQYYMDYYCLGHSISMMVYGDLDNKWFDNFLKSLLVTTYYKLDLDQSYLDKANPFGSSNQSCEIGVQCSSCGSA